MKCSHCGYADSKVLDTRQNDEGVRRRRECLRCGARFSTVEKALASTISVAKRDGRTEEFSRVKLLSGIRTACAKRPIPAGVIEKMADDIEEELQKRGQAEVSTRLIGELAMDRLGKLDRVAYIRFASVYRDFADEDDFQRAVEGLRDGSVASSNGQMALLPPERSGARPRGRPRTK